ncbi:MAG TPA: hypothetical protein VI341_09745 [Actinomycetota bacterium]
MPAIALVAVIAGVVAGADAALSAGLAIILVFANFVFFAVSVAYAARISLTLLYGVALGGFLVRMAILVVLLLLLQQLAWFSIVAFIAAFVAGTVVLLSVEIKMIAGRMQADLWNLPDRQGSHR